MTNRGFFLSRREAELPAFQRVFEALPADQLDYRPHPDSPTAAQIVSTMVNEIKACCELASEGQTVWRPAPPTDREAMIADYGRHHETLQSSVTAITEDEWTRPARFLVGDAVKMESPLGELLWFFHFDAIHHRGQLSTYLRPMGGRVPSIYGPSGDSK